MISMFPLLGYIDPGTGSFLLQLLVGGLLGGLATLKLSWARLRGLGRSAPAEDTRAEAE